MSTILITGGTGMIGKALGSALLEKNHDVIMLSRQSKQQNGSPPGFMYATWNIEAQTIDKDAIINTDYIVHLAGAGVADKRWTKKRKQQIVYSRVKGGELLVKALKENTNNVKAVISASAIGWYVHDSSIPNKDPFIEDAAASDDFLGQTCKQWEESLEPVRGLGKRLVKLRTGIVLSSQGGALEEFLKPLRFGVAPILGSGKQIISWIHIDDLVRIYLAAIENENMNGVYNAVAPRPVSNKEFVLQLSKVKRRRFFVPVYIPSFILKLVLGEMSIEVLKSATVSCDKIHFAGFTFLYPSIKAAIQQIVA